MTAQILNLDKRPSPPKALTERQTEIWQDIVASEAADWFSTTALRDLLTNYCRAQDAVNQIQAEIDRLGYSLADENVFKKFQILDRMRKDNIRMVKDIATSLRLTNQARYTPKAAGTAQKNKGSVKKPWDI